MANNYKYGQPREKALFELDGGGAVRTGLLAVIQLNNKHQAGVSCQVHSPHGDLHYSVASSGYFQNILFPEKYVRDCRNTQVKGTDTPVAVERTSAWTLGDMDLLC